MEKIKVRTIDLIFIAQRMVAFLTENLYSFHEKEKNFNLRQIYSFSSDFSFRLFVNFSKRLNVIK